MLFEIGAGRTLLNGGVEVLLRAKEKTSIEGRESNYYIAHGLSFLTEKIKSVTGLLQK
jgi:hypothetical protein